MPRLKKTTIEFEGQTSEREVIVPDEQPEPWGEDARLRVVGQALPRVDGPARVTGQALYTTDVRLPGMLHAAILRSPHAHALVRAVDSAAAEAMDGVHLVWHRRQPPPVAEFGGRPIFGEEVAFQGAEVALVVAGSLEVARAAAAAIRVDYEVLPFAVDLQAALAGDAPRVRHDEAGNLVDPEGDAYERGDVARGWQEAEVTVDLTMTTAAAVHSALEPHGCVARWEGDELTLWESTQGVFAVRNQVARALGVPLGRVRVICDFMGGGFGAKQTAGMHTILAAQAARATGRPVRLILDRREEQLVGGYRPATRQRIRLGARADGTLTCIEHEAWSHLGSHGGDGFSTTGPARTLYACPNVRAVVWNVRANTDEARAFRAPGYVEGNLPLECAMDDLAAKLGLDPLDLRLKNYAETHPQGGTPYTTKGLRAAYEQGADRFGWRQRREAPPTAGPGSPWRRGWGMASQIWGGGGGPPARAIVKLLRDGSVEVLAGVQDIGTGTRTALAQIAAEELGVEVGTVRVVVGDTLPTPYGPTSSGSQTLPSAGPAVRAAARDCKRQLLDLAAQMLDRPGIGADQLEVRDGTIVHSADPALRLPFAEVARKLGGYTLVGDGARGPNPEGLKTNTFGAQFAEVEVNVETGEVRVRRVVAVHDVGRIINPLTAASQVYGGIVQGTGYAILEERVLDDQLGADLNPNLEHYYLPTVMDVPRMEAGFVDLPDPRLNNVGAKGLGEPPIIPTAPAIANAVCDAIGVRLTDFPLTRRRVLDGLRAAGRSESEGEGEGEGERR